MLTSTGNNWCWAANITTSSAYNDNKSTSCFMALGAQQWGLSTNSAGHKDVFPISFTSNCYSVSFCNDQGVHYNVNCSIVSCDRLGVTWYTNCNGYWIAVGRQQWGAYGSIGEESTVSVSLPLALSTSVYWGCMTTHTGNPSGRGFLCVIPQSLTVITLYNANRVISNAFWCVIGK